MGIAAVHADPAPDNAKPAVAAPGIEAARVYRDPETGELGPPPANAAPFPAPTELSAATRARLSRSDEGLQARTLPDGTQLLDLQGRFQNFSVVTLDRHGDKHLYCSHSVDQVERALQQGGGSGGGDAGSAP